MNKSIYFDGIKSIPLEALDRMLFPELFEDSKSSINESKAYEVVAWVYRAVQLRANAISSIPFAVVQDGEPIDFEFADRLPNLLQLTEASLNLYGAAYWLKEHNLVRLRDLRWAVATTIKPRLDPDRGLLGFERRLGGEIIPLAPEEVVYFWLPDPQVEIGPGQAPAKVALDAAGLMYNINRFAAAFFERGAVYPTILTVEGNPRKEDLDKLEAWWKRLIAGVRSAWETVALRSNVNVTTLSQDISEMAMTDLSQSVRQQIAVAFGIPQTMMEDAANFATSREHRLSFWHETIIPEAKLIAGVLNEQLFAPLGLEFIWLFEELEPLQQDEISKTDAVVRLVETGIISADEARHLLNIQERTAEQQLPAPNDEVRQLDLRRWQKVSLKLLDAGKNPASRVFASDHIAPEEKRVIYARLQHARTREEVRAAFRPPFRAYQAISA